MEGPMPEIEPSSSRASEPISVAASMLDFQLA
jgi:hypothetical protein